MKPKQIELTKSGSKWTIHLHPSTNSFGEPNYFASKRPAHGKKEFQGLRGWPLYAIQTWAVGRGYTYEVK